MELISCSREQTDSIAAFDTLCTNPKIQLLKILISYVSPPLQGKLAFYIKLSELQYTIRLLQNHVNLCFSPPAPDKICEEMDPYLAPEERSKVKSVQELLHSLENVKDMMDMVNSMKELFPEGFDPGSVDEGGMENIFEIINQFGGMNGTDKQTVMDE